MPILALIAYYALAVVAAVHVLRTGRPIYWLFILFMFPLLGGLVYLVAELGPEMAGGRTANKMRAAARKAMEPDREYRAAKAALEETPSAGARMRLAAVAMALGKAEEAERCYREAAQGQFADDPAILMGHAQALLELGRHGEALERLELLSAQGAPGQTPQAALAFARAYEGLGRFDEADAPYRFAADRSPGLEAAARYVAFMAKTGRREDARTGLGELERRYQKIPSHFRAEAKRWRDFAAQAAG